MNKLNIREEVIRYLMEEVIDGPQVTVGPSTLLIEQGILTSFGVLALIGHVERKYAVAFDLGELGPDDFSSVDAIATLVLQKLQALDKSRAMQAAAIPRRPARRGA